MLTIASNEANIPNNIPAETRAIVDMYSSYIKKVRSLKKEIFKNASEPPRNKLLPSRVGSSFLKKRGGANLWEKGEHPASL